MVFREKLETRHLISYKVMTWLNGVTSPRLRAALRSVAIRFSALVVSADVSPYSCKAYSVGGATNWSLPSLARAGLVLMGFNI